MCFDTRASHIAGLPIDGVRIGCGSVNEKIHMSVFVSVQYYAIISRVPMIMISPRNENLKIFCVIFILY
jgi:hypothetical protein